MITSHDLLFDATTFNVEDIFLAASAAVIVAAVIISAAVLSRYRSLTGEAARSNQLAKDLWATLENRLKKQDERIVDLMARVEVFAVQSERRVEVRQHERTRDVDMRAAAALNPLREGGVGLPSLVKTSKSAAIENVILRKLMEGPKSSTEIRAVLDRSREHTARLMKALFDDGYVVRNDRERPFVYEITDLGKRHVEESRSAGT